VHHLVFVLAADAQPLEGQNNRLVPLLRSNAILSIPLIGMSPKLEEIQAGITRVADNVLLVMRGVAQWNKDRLTHVSSIF